jgi:phosphatidylethanolamine-binding protein (PEBP) family uncharacterized protein
MTRHTTSWYSCFRNAVHTSPGIVIASQAITSVPRGQREHLVAATSPDAAMQRWWHWRAE